MKKVVIFGIGDFAQVAHVYLKADSPHEIVAFTVHESYITEPTLRGLPVVPYEKLTEVYPPDQFSLFIALGYSRVNQNRADLYHECKALGYELISYICSKAMQWGEIEVGDNCFIFEANVLQPFVRIGNNVVLWSGNHIGHHTTIGDHCFIASHVVISGNCKIESGCFIGVNATFRDSVTVGANSVIGAGAVILGNTLPGGVYRGTDTKPMEIKSSQLKKI